MSAPNHEPEEGVMSVHVYIPTPFRRATAAFLSEEPHFRARARPPRDR